MSKYLPKQKRYRATHPWTRHVEWAQRRCQDPEHHHGSHGIECHISYAEARRLWERDNAAALVKPSLDRKDPAGHYTFDNCRFIEKAINERLPHDAALREEYEFCRAEQARIEEEDEPPF